MFKKNLPLRIGVGAIVLNNNNKIFVGKRKDNPCTSCNAEGTILGKKHANKWHEIYENQ